MSRAHRSRRIGGTDGGDPVRSELRRRNTDALTEALDLLCGIDEDVSAALSALPLEQMSATEALCWWTASNGWLENRRPIDVIRSEPAAVRRAAQRLADESPL